MGEEHSDHIDTVADSNGGICDRRFSRVSFQLSASMLPTDTSVSFKDSSFFLQNRGHPLPSPAEVRSHSNGFTYPGTPSPVRFDNLNLLVKYGREITIAEGQCLWAVRRLLGGSVPVPEVYGWCQDSDEVFIYMELIQGETLQRLWGCLNDSERSDICDQLHQIIQSLRQLQQSPTDQFIGGIGRQRLRDMTFSGASDGVPFSSVQAFQDWFAWLPKRGFLDIETFPDPYRSGLPDNSSIKFTHGDLHSSNIIISRDKPPRIRSIIDWHQSGWFPAYWEYCKARMTANPDGEWATKYIPMFLEEYRDCYESYEFYAGSLGY